MAWTSVSLPFFEHDFRMRSLYGQPAGSSVEDWPLDFAELEPFYFKAEQDLGVSGTVMPWERPDRPPRPFPPFAYYRTSERLKTGMDKLRIRSAPGPVAVASRTAGNRTACLHCGFCRSGCRIDAKYQADHTLIKDALATGRLTIIDNAMVFRINQGIQPRVATGVSFVDLRNGNTYSVKSRLLFVCNNPFEIPRLFLNSASPRHPNGLGNRFDNMGRHLLSHPGAVAVGVTDECMNGSIGYNMGNIVTLDFGTPRPRQRYYSGFVLEAINGAGAGVIAVDTYAHLFGSELKNTLRTYNQSLFVIAFCDGLPVRDNRVTVDPNALDEHGIPKAKIHYDWHPNDLKVLGAAKRALHLILKASGAHTVQLTEKPFEAHPGGSMRMGRSPRTSVTDPFGRVHELDNVYIGGAALFVTGSSVNPTQTLHALALRTADHVKRRFRL
ncbi:GMC oxidoreductase [Alkalilimnicola ehrlichii]|uniref:GMC oxidoreductase n=1 Tax=Alkalilimnicola ehrlichii TaxID=351052 RepID=UPI0011C047D0|nr:GMC family oxidoreductase [Alkalilimnicola ehrlichii]